MSGGSALRGLEIIEMSYNGTFDENDRDDYNNSVIYGNSFPQKHQSAPRQDMEEQMKEQIKISNSEESVKDRAEKAWIEFKNLLERPGKAHNQTTPFLCVCGNYFSHPQNKDSR